MQTDLHRPDGVLVVGAGLAGLFTALRLAPMPVTVLSPAPLGDGASSAWAQGGIAAALGAGDSPAAHAADTIEAGAGTVDGAIAASVAAEARARIEDLLRIGTPFDRDAAGALVQSREAAHSASRVVRVRGDTAGAAIMACVIAAVRATPSITVVEGVSVDDLRRSDGRIVGVRARAVGRPEAAPVQFTARAVVLATGGIGGLYADTSNPDGVNGQGLGMAARAGAVIRDPEFVQFHPTGLAVGLAVSARPTPLASEALRGEGAVLIDETGRRFMVGLHAGAELAPRDVVARALHRHIAAGHRVFLDTRTGIGPAIEAQFPTITAACRAAGIDPVRDPIPVRPIQHYHMGGVRTDDAARTSLPGLWAVGEVACTGLHGANRLASNSLLEALVFGARAADDIAGLAGDIGRVSAVPAEGNSPCARVPGDLVARLRRTMTADVGVERDGSGLSHALAIIAEVEKAVWAEGGSASLLNMTACATLVAAAALTRCESRGAHMRTDHPTTDPTQAVATDVTLAEVLELRADALRAEAA